MSVTFQTIIDEYSEDLKKIWKETMANLSVWETQYLDDVKKYRFHPKPKFTVDIVEEE